VTSVAAIVALLGAYLLGATALDPVMGLVGAALILRWSWGLSRSAAQQLLDVVPSRVAMERIRDRLEAIADTKVADLHLWEMAPGRRGCIVSLVAAEPRDVADYRAAVAEAADVHHLTVEVFRCPQPAR
jgi:Co/Zn/Cd efflux system component